MIKRLTIAVAVTLFVSPAMLVRAQEHPREHPQQSQLQQVPQSITRSSQGGFQTKVQTKQMSKADISAGIKKQIASDTRKSSDKKFHVKYGAKVLALDLIKVHDDRLSNLGGGKYFACVDMKAADGTIYDIDFFMAGQPGSMKVTETSVHKVNGKPLYNWKEQGGVWKKVRVS